MKWPLLALREAATGILVVQSVHGVMLAHPTVELLHHKLVKEAHIHALAFLLVFAPQYFVIHESVKS